MSRARGPLRQDFPRDPAALLRQLRAWRDELIKIEQEVTIQGPVYRACHAITEKIDDLAGWLTGNREHFWDIGSGPTSGQLEKQRRWMAIERGDEPWPEDSLDARTPRS